VAQLSISQAALLLGVSPDTIRRWADSGRLASTRGPGGRRLIDGQALAGFAQSLAADQTVPALNRASARNRFSGIVTNVVKDRVMAQVEVQAGPHRIVSLMSREAADELKLAPGVLVVAAVKATNVVVELPGRP
jgi:molybdopterin-binding protein